MAGPCFLPRPDKLFSVLSVEELVREIEQYQCLRALRLEGNTVGVDAARAIAKALEGKDLLQVLLSLYFALRVNRHAGSRPGTEWAFGR